MPANRYELLASWYLRFNGFFTTPDFTVHPDFKKQPGGTDADVLAVRFPHSEEYQRKYEFERDPQLIRFDRVEFVICEVKSSVCDLNGATWRDEKRANVEYAIRWMGFEPSQDKIDALAKSVRRTGLYEDGQFVVRFVCFGKHVNEKLAAELPKAQQVVHIDVIRFLRRRFTLNCYMLARANWDEDIREFATLCRKSSDDELLTWAGAH